MADSRIEWTDSTWNPVTGCTRASSGCDNCYAVTMTKRLEAMGQEKYSGLVNIGKNHFNGVVKCHEDALMIPFDWKRPRRVFVNSMSDLFHKDVPETFIARVWATMASCQWHTFQVLTKRPERAAEILNGWNREHGGLGFASYVPPGGKGDSYLNPWPLPNVWIGTSVEDQKTADERIPHLLKVPAAVRFLSCEPLLGPVDLHLAHSPDVLRKPGEQGFIQGMAEAVESIRIHWVICGGESGPKARPMNVAWAYDLKRQCEAASVPFFMKQLGKAFYHSGYRDGEDLITAGPKGADWEHENFPDDLKIREFPGVARG